MNITSNAVRKQMLSFWNSVQFDCRCLYCAKLTWSSQSTLHRLVINSASSLQISGPPAWSVWPSEGWLAREFTVCNAHTHCHVILVCYSILRCTPSSLVVKMQEIHTNELIVSSVMIAVCVCCELERLWVISQHEELRPSGSQCTQILHIHTNWLLKPSH